MKQCVTYKKFKEEEEFNWRYKALGIRAKICRGVNTIIKERAISIIRIKRKKEPAEQK